MKSKTVVTSWIAKGAVNSELSGRATSRSVFFHRGSSQAAGRDASRTNDATRDRRIVDSAGRNEGYEAIVGGVDLDPDAGFGNLEVHARLNRIFVGTIAD